jgi:hypothetical protein
LFINAFPSIHLVPGRSWDEVARIEIQRRDGLCAEWIDPEVEAVDEHIDCSSRVIESGQYRIRVISSGNGEVVDSKTVRYLRGLKSVKVDPSAVFPDADGYGVTRIRFEADKTTRVSACAELAGQRTEVMEGEISALLPPCPEADHTRWLIRDWEYETILDVHLQRAWWAISRSNAGSRDYVWTDRALSLSRDDFRASSQARVLVRLPQVDGLDVDGVGLSWENRRTLSLVAGESYLSLPLRSFFDDGALEESESERAFRIFIRLHGVAGSITLASIQTHLLQFADSLTRGM